MHIFALTETQIVQNCSNELLERDGYKFMRLDRNGDGGAIGICNAIYSAL